MKLKTLKISLVATSLFIGGTLFMDNSVKAATHSVYSSYWNKTRTVKVTKRTVFKHFDELKHRYTGARRIFKPGQKIKVRAAGEFIGWTLPGKPGSRYWWINTKRTSNWMEEYHKVYKARWNGNVYHSSNGSTFRIKSLKRVSIYSFDSDEHSQPTETVLVLSGRLTNNGKTITPAKWLDDNMDIYPSKTSEDNMIFGCSDSDSLLKDDDNYHDDLEEATDPLPKDYYTDFSIILDGDDTDKKAASYTFSDISDNHVDIPVTNDSVTVDDED